MAGQLIPQRLANIQYLASQQYTLADMNNPVPQGQRLQPENFQFITLPDNVNHVAIILTLTSTAGAFGSDHSFALISGANDFTMTGNTATTSGVNTRLAYSKFVALSNGLPASPGNTLSYMFIAGPRATSYVTSLAGPAGWSVLPNNIQGGPHGFVSPVQAPTDSGGVDGPLTPIIAPWFRFLPNTITDPVWSFDFFGFSDL